MQKFLLDERYLSPDTRNFYREVLTRLGQSKIPFLVGGAFAFGCYTHVVRDTKDLDVFVYPQDAESILDELKRAGFQTEFTDRLWIAKAFHGECVVDVIFGSGNGIGNVDEEWFIYSCKGDLLDIEARLIPPEEMIWSKAFVMSRDRYDGADIAHLLLTPPSDWTGNALTGALMTLAGPHNHLSLSGISIHPSARAFRMDHAGNGTEAQRRNKRISSLKRSAGGPFFHGGLRHRCRAVGLSRSQAGETHIQKSG